MSDWPASLSGHGAPTLVGANFVGQLYLDVDTGDKYIAQSLVVGDWLLSAGGGGGIEYVERPAPIVAYDFEVGDLIVDGLWHTLDLSAIVPAEAAGLYVHLLGVTRRTTTGGASINFRRPGTTTDALYCLAFSNDGAANTTHRRQIQTIPLDATRKIEYYVSAVAWSALNLTVAGWWRPA